jgi:DNA-binding CsgD family transcriptional regulator
MNLTDREKQIVELSSQGFIASEISYILSISERTVEEHLKNSRKKLGAKNTNHLIFLASKAGIISSIFLAISMIPAISSFGTDIMRPSRGRPSFSRIARQARGNREWEILS